MIESCGELEITDFDDTNVPVDIWLTELPADEEKYKKGFRFVLRVGNYMPRNVAAESCGAVEIYSTERNELQELVKTCILPIYEKAIAQINGIIEGKGCSLYYWDGKNHKQ